jgi:hypothetical protein
VGPVVAKAGTHELPSHTRLWPPVGAVAAIARPWIWVALPLVALVVE